MNHKRNVEGLRQSAQKRRQAALQRTDNAIRLLLRDGRPINFKTVSEAAKVSTAWLYQQEEIKQQIRHLRETGTQLVKLPLPQRERASNASKEAIIAALRQRVKKLDEENLALRKQLEVAYGELHQRSK